MTRQILQPIFGAALACAALSAPPPRHPPVAIVEHLDARSITGSATDGDVPGRPVTLHIYVDGRLYDGAIANPRFEYRHAPFGAGKHRVEVYALGMDATGRLDGQNIRATGPNIDDFGCAPLEGDSPAFVWCHDMPPYWAYRQLDTTPLFNKHIWIGVDNSYGGMIAQLYGEDRSVNLLQEHGGSAMQISLWGYEDIHGPNPDGYFRKSPPVNPVCDPTPYPSQAACDAGGSHCAGQGEMAVRPTLGRQVTTCSNVCNGWEVSAPWNPLQAQGAQCSWDDRAGRSQKANNDVKRGTTFVDHGLPGWSIFYDSFSNFTKGKTIAGMRGAGTFPGLSVEQSVTLGDVYAKVQYTIRYARNAPLTLGRHPQEIPALYTGKGIAIRGYRSGEPEQAVCERGSPGCPSSRAIPPSGGWWGVCDTAKTKCLTVATFDNLTITRDTMERTADGYGRLTPSGDFALVPGLEKTFTVYVFPYGADHVIEGRSIAQRIEALRTR